VTASKGSRWHCLRWSSSTAGSRQRLLDLTVGEIRRLAPELTVLAVDLPGRRGKPGDLAAVRIADCVDSVIADVESAD